MGTLIHSCGTRDVVTDLKCAACAAYRAKVTFDAIMARYARLVKVLETI